MSNFFELSLVSRHTRIHIFKTIARPVLSYGSEAWTIRRVDERRLILAEMHFIRRTAGYNCWDHKSNEDILAELQILQITEFIYQYRKNWKEHVERTSSERIPKMILKYNQEGKEI
jgi:hypothetical protein